jgi:dTDP-4-dehydrorhamnose 3,5-epimerase
MIDGVIITPLKQICDERGKVMHMLRNDANVFKSFGEIYFSCVYPGAIKGWHIHKKMILNYAVPYGCIKFVLYDERKESKTRGEVVELFLGPDNYCLVTVPPMVWSGFKGAGKEMAIVANCASLPYDSLEIERKDPFDPAIPYNWESEN